MGRTVCVDLDTEKREGERLEIYIRCVPLTIKPPSGQLYLYMQQGSVTLAA